MKKVASTSNPDMDVYRCNPCRYYYYPEIGDPTQNIPPGTPFTNSLIHGDVLPVRNRSLRLSG